jgi:hypothetical protein
VKLLSRNRNLRLIGGVLVTQLHRILKPHEKHIEEEKPINVPPGLDLTPCRDEKDFGLLQRLVRMGRTK